MSEQIVWGVVSLAVINIGSIIGLFWRMNASIIRLEVIVKELEKDINNLGRMVRSSKKGE